MCRSSRVPRLTRCEASCEACSRISQSLVSGLARLNLFYLGRAPARRDGERQPEGTHTPYTVGILYTVYFSGVRPARPRACRVPRKYGVCRRAPVSLSPFSGASTIELRARALPTRRKYRETSPCVVSRAWSRESCVLLLVIHTAPARSGAGFSSGSAFSLASRPALKCLDRRLSLIASQMIHPMQ